MHKQENQNEAFFSALAKQYAETDGLRLQQEAAQSTETPDLSRLDGLTNRSFRKKRNRSAVRTMGYISMAAACVLLLLVGNSILRNINHKTAEAPSYNDASTEEATQLIPLHFTLPQDYTLQSAELDQGESMYHILDPYRDEIILSLKTGALSPEIASYPISEINGFAVYGLSGEGYALMTFERDGVVFVLSCRSGMADLETLAEVILS